MHMWHLRKGTNIMMVTNSLSGTGGLQPKLPGMNVKMDSTSKNIQNQIANAQKKLQELSSNTEMGVEEKMKKRQEIQQEITSLQQQLRQHQIMQRKEQQKDASVDDMLPARSKDKNTGNKGNGLSQAGMQAMISADSSVKQAKVQGSTVSKFEGRAGVLEAEIKQDTGKTGVEKKQEELAALQQKAMAASAAQMSSLAEAEKAAGEASKAEQAAGGTDNKEDKENKTGKAQEEEAVPQENANPAELVKAESVQPVAYVPVDIIL